MQYGISTGCSCEPTYEELKPHTDLIQILRDISCEPTYEELKLGIKGNRIFIFCCCEPTYEELKQISEQVLRAERRSCEPTYEELKLSTVILIMPFYCVASLPMRN